MLPRAASQGSRLAHKRLDDGQNLRRKLDNCLLTINDGSGFFAILAPDNEVFKVFSYHISLSVVVDDLTSTHVRLTGIRIDGDHSGFPVATGSSRFLRVKPPQFPAGVLCHITFTILAPDNEVFRGFQSMVGVFIAQ